MKLKVNKDFLVEYQDDLWHGFSPRECLYMALGATIAVAVGVGVWFLTRISPQIAIYTGLPFAGVIMFIGRYDYQGYMTIRELISEWRYTTKCGSVTTDNGERFEGRRVFFLETDEGENLKRQKAEAKRMKKDKEV